MSYLQTVEAVCVGAAVDSRQSVSRTEHQACGRLKNREGEKKDYKISEINGNWYISAMY